MAETGVGDSRLQVDLQLKWVG